MRFGEHHAAPRCGVASKDASRGCPTARGVRVCTPVRGLCRHLQSVPASVRFVSAEPLLGSLEATIANMAAWIIANGIRLRVLS